jgi:hypothetical protein
MPEKALTLKVRKSKTPRVKVSVTVTEDLYARILACIELEGNTVISEFCAVAIMRRCREIEAAETATGRMQP